MLVSPGCKTKDELSDLSPAEVATAEAYIDELNALSAALSSIRDEEGAREAVPELEKIVAKIGELDTEINGFPRKSLRAVRQHFSGRFEFAGRQINHEAVRLLSQSATGKVLRKPLTPVAQYVR
jgi:hypothetical protein